VKSKIINSLQVMNDELTKDPAFGDHTPLFDAMLLAFEQEDFCDFEIQFEVRGVCDNTLNIYT
jgi:hypothetical protein